jgi:hypothetical protein
MLSLLLSSLGTFTGEDGKRYRWQEAKGSIEVRLLPRSCHPLSDNRFAAGSSR